jgi:hypothetical protein
VIRHAELTSVTARSHRRARNPRDVPQDQFRVFLSAALSIYIANGPMPPALAARFTQAEMAAFRIVSDEAPCIAIAARAG